MNIQFKDRERELKELKETLGSNQFELIIIYGRRRIGKTELILNATQNKKRIYYLATEGKNLNRFYQTCNNYDKETTKLKPDWETLFDYLKDKTEAIIIDEFQNLIKEDKNILSIFQAITDTILKNSKTKLFLLGSSISIITSKILSYQSPLYGRRTGTINLKAVPFFELAKFFPEKNAEQLAEIYGFADGIPLYLTRIGKEFWPWLDNELKKEKTFLRDEIDFLMRYEFADTSTYKLILEAIANGNTKLNEIKEFISAKRTDITPYLKNLIETNFIQRRVPITENTISRKGRYYLSDNFLTFWFKHIYPNLSAIEEQIFDIATIKNNYSQYMGRIFEKISHQFITTANIFKPTKIGTWWHKDKEIDIVALNESTKEILFAECKWQEKVNPEQVMKELAEKTQYVEWNNETRKETYAIFAKTFTKKITSYQGKKVQCIDLKDIEQALKR